MKRWKQIAAALLCLALLVCCMPVQAEEAVPDFAALLAQGNTPKLISVTAAPVYSLSSVCDWQGQYALVRDLEGCWYVADCYGTVRCMLDPEATSEMENGKIEGGFLVTARPGNGGESWQQLFNFDGKRLTETEIHSGEALYDLATGQVRYYSGSEGSNLLLFDDTGKHLSVSEFGPVYNGNMTYRIGNVWYAGEPFGQILYKGVFDRLEFVSGDLLLCGRNGKYGLVRTDGEVAVPLCYEDLQSFAGFGIVDRIAAKQDGKWGVIDFEGTQRLPFAYSAITPQAADPDELPDTVCDTGFYVVQDFAPEGLSGQKSHLTREDDRYLYQGSRELPSTLLQVLSPERFVVDGLGLVDANGTVLVPDARLVQPVGDRLLLRFGSGSGGSPRTELRSADLTLLQSFPTSSVWPGDRVLFVQTEDAVEVRDLDGKLLQNFENARYCIAGAASGPVLLQKDGRYALVTADGLESTGFCYDDASVDPVHPIASVKENGKRCVVDVHGTRLLPYALDKPLFFFPEGHPYTAFVVDNKFGFLHIRQAGEPAFADVKPGSWYADSVEFCYNAGLMNGVGGGCFSPNETMTRAMLVQVLYNMSGWKCESHGFRDVSDTAWYADAVNWAAANGIVSGVSETSFAPNRAVTREQTVTILARFAGKFMELTAPEHALDRFTDADKVSDYAVDAFRWAVSQGIITGTSETTLSPQGRATRAQIAAILMRFVKLMATA